MEYSHVDVLISATKLMYAPDFKGRFRPPAVNRLIDWFWFIKLRLVLFYTVPSTDWLLDFNSSNFDWSIFTLCRQLIDWLILIHQTSIGPFLRCSVNRLIAWFQFIKLRLVHFHAVPSTDWLIDFDSSNFDWSIFTLFRQPIDWLILVNKFCWTVLNSVKPSRWVFTSGSKNRPLRSGAYSAKILFSSSTKKTEF